MVGLCLLSLFVPDSVAAADLYVVAAKNANGGSKSINVSEIITGKQRKWSDGAPIMVILPSKEALLRWRGEAISIQEVIDAAEESELILRLG